MSCYFKNVFNLNLEFQSVFYYSYQLIRWPKRGYILTGICIFGSCLSNFLISKSFNLTTEIFRVGFHLSDCQGFIKGNFESYNYLIEKPYTRVSSYLVGILLGHYLSSTRMGITARRNSVFLYCGWIISAIFMWISFFSLGNAEESLIKFAVFNGMKHLLFACGISWFIFVCSTGQAEFLNRCLSWHGFVVLSRLAFCAYLLNFLVLEYHFLRLTELREPSFAYAVIISACVFFWTFVASFVVSAVIEIPVSSLYSKLLSKGKND